MAATVDLSNGLASTLTQDEIPINPLSAEDCKPNKALRTTIKVFLRTEEKKRETLRAKQKKEQTAIGTEDLPPTATQLPSSDGVPLVAAAPNAGLPSKPQASQVTEEGVGQITGNDDPHNAQGGSVVPEQESVQLDNQEQSTSNGLLNQEAPLGDIQASHNSEGGNNSGTQDHTEIPPLSGPNGSWDGQFNQEQMQMFNVGGNGMNNGENGFSGMNWNGQTGFEPMMQSMQNGMSNGGWGPFPNVMNMPGMNMDPMAMSQGLYGGYSGQGMGMNGMGGMNAMNGMSMGMGMGFNSGHGGYDGWSGQNAWNAGQDKFNPNANGGNVNGMGEFGANTGYYPTAGGYNPQSHGNFSQMNPQQYHNHDLQDPFRGQAYNQRSRGRGRGAVSSYTRGRGGAFGPRSQGNPDVFHHQLPISLPQQMNLAGNQQASGGNDDLVTAATNELAPNSAEASAGAHVDGGDVGAGGETNTLEAKTNGGDVKDENVDVDNAGPSGGSSAANIIMGTAAPAGPRAESDTPQGTNVAVSSENAGAVLSKIESVVPSTNNETSISPAKKEIVAPLGPAALMHGNQLQDVPSRGRGVAPRAGLQGAGIRGRGGSGGWQGLNGNVPTGPSVPTSEFPGVVIPTEPKGRGVGVVGAPKAPKALREGLPNTGIRGRGFSIIGRGGLSTGAGRASSVKSKRTRGLDPDLDPQAVNAPAVVDGTDTSLEAPRKTWTVTGNEDPPDDDDALKSMREEKTIRRSKSRRGLASPQPPRPGLTLDLGPAHRPRQSDPLIEPGERRTAHAVPTATVILIFSHVKTEAAIADTVIGNLVLEPPPTKRERSPLEQRLVSPSTDMTAEGEAETGPAAAMIVAPRAANVTVNENENDPHPSQSPRKAINPIAGERVTALNARGVIEIEIETETEKEKDKGKGKEREKEKGKGKGKGKDHGSKTSKTRRGRNHHPPPGPPQAVDIHTLEREARNRERLLKEKQRRDERDRERRESSGTQQQQQQQQQQQRKRDRESSNQTPNTNTHTNNSECLGGAAAAAANTRNDNDNDNDIDIDRADSKRRRKQRQGGGGGGGSGGVGSRKESSGLGNHGSNVNVNNNNNNHGSSSNGNGNGNGNGNNGTAGRRVSYAFQDDESDEARAVRVENEREAGRWG
ncbi:MAG: hypothetical protein M1837_006181 [Sclerophora amabilis]|nr:MAG: hypothetical protein M1837_006181 [Sclerophora amabilis]